MEIMLTLPHTAPFLRKDLVRYSREHRVSIMTASTPTQRRPARGLRHAWQGDVSRRPCQGAAPGDTPRRWAAAASQGVKTQRERATDTETHNESGTGNAKSDALRAPAPVVGPHDGGSSHTPACVAGVDRSPQRVESPTTRPRGMGLLLPNGEVCATPHRQDALSIGTHQGSVKRHDRGRPARGRSPGAIPRRYRAKSGPLCAQGFDSLAVRVPLRRVTTGAPW
jgi:hypothetical protein